MQKERLSWIDICRGIGILLVLYGHGLSGQSYRYLIYAFHMPLFFFLSGVVYHHRNYSHIFSFLPKTIRGILFPYFFFALLTLIVSIFQSNHSQLISSSTMHQLFGIIYGNGNNGMLAFNVVLWFLPCLFVTKVTFACLTHFIKRPRWIGFALLLFSLIGYLFSRAFPSIKLPFGIETALTAIVFFGAGFLLNTLREKHKLSLQNHAGMLFISSLVVCISLAMLSYSLYGTQIDMRMNRYHNYFLFYIPALSGILSCITLSMILRKNNLLEYIGKQSMLLFVWHLLVFSSLSQVFRLLMNASTLRSWRDIVFASLYTILATILILTADWSVKKCITLFQKR